MTEATEHIIQLSRPHSGNALREGMEPGLCHRLDFFPEEATFESDGPDLRLNFDDGATLTLTGFFSILEQGDFTLELPDGTLLSGKDVVESLTLVLEDFHTDAADAAPHTPAETTGHGPLFHSDEPSGLLCHESCGLFDENITLPGAPDPLFDVRMTPFSRSTPPPDLPNSTPTPDPANSDAHAPEPGGNLSPLTLNAMAPALPVPALSRPLTPWPATLQDDDVLRQDDILSPAHEALTFDMALGPSFTLLCEAAPQELPLSMVPEKDDCQSADDWLLAFWRLGGL